MTLTGFEHTAENIYMKKKLDAGSIRPEFQDVVSSRKSRSRISGRDSWRDDLHNPPSEGKSARSMTRDGFQVIEADEVPPMNEDISSNEGDPVVVEPIADSGDIEG